MDYRRLTRRSFAKQVMVGTAALGSLRLTSAHAQTPVALGVPTVGVPMPSTIADGLVVERLYDRTFTSTPAWVLDVRNGTDQTWAAPGVTMSFLDSQGNIVGENHPFQLLEDIRPGQFVPYLAEFYEFHPADAEWSTIGFSLKGQWPAKPLYPDDFFEIHDTVEESDGKTWRVTGTVTNVSDVVVESVGVSVIIRSHADEFLGSTSTTVTTPIRPGDSARFVCDTGDSTAVTADPFDVANNASQFEVQLVATPMATAWLG